VGRKPTSVNLEEEHIEWMEERNINRSELVNKLIEEYKNGESIAESAISTVKVDELEMKEKAKEKELELIREKKATYQKKQKRKKESQRAELPEAIDALSGIDLEVGNPAVENWAEQLNMTQEELIQTVEEHNE